MNEDIAVFMFLSVSVASSLSLVAVVIWVTQRQKERAAYYRSETIKRVAELGSSSQALEFLRETDLIAQRNRRNGLKLASLILPAAGAGLMVFLYYFVPREPVYLVGVIPILVGGALLVYSLVVARD